jgi:mannose-6-phosphate isomerase-like protein (cupin superfamily)
MIVDTSWGKETIFASTENYCGKFLEFTEAGNKTSMHFHMKKDESLVVTNGTFKVHFFDLSLGKADERVLRAGDTWRNPPMFPHQIEALEAGSVIIEVSNSNLLDDTFKLSSEDN